MLSKVIKLVGILDSWDKTKLILLFFMTIIAMGLEVISIIAILPIMREFLSSEKKFDFRTACAVINDCNMYLGNEGGFGHAAAALNKKALIYFGGWIGPQSTGYAMHENIYYDDTNSPCGAIGYPCNHCEKARQSIKVEYLEEKVNFILE